MAASKKKVPQKVSPSTNTTGAAPAERLLVKLILPPSVQNDLDALSEKHYRQVMAKLRSLEGNPHPHDRRPMTDYPGVFRVDCGEYRIGFTETKTATEHTVRIALVDRRNDKQFYKAIKRRLGL